LLITCIFLSFFLVGCSDYSELEKGITEKNIKVENLLANYEKSKQKGLILEEAVLSDLVTKDVKSIQNLEVLSYSSELTIDVVMSFSYVSDAIYAYIDYTNEQAKITASDSVPVARIDNIEEFIKSVIEVHYFLDDKTGKTEQMFLVQLPDGYLTSVSLMWLGGSVIDVKTYNNN
jgi:hypothetical protein